MIKAVEGIYTKKQIKKYKRSERYFINDETGIYIHKELGFINKLTWFNNDLIK